jgi:hypothetical protein
MVGKIRDEVWNGHFRSLKKYLETHDNTYPSARGSFRKYLHWAYKQRERGKIGRLTAKRIALLDSINFDWGVERSLIRPIDGSDPDGADEADEDADDTSSVGSTAGAVPTVERQVKLDNGPGAQFKVGIPVYYKECSASDTRGLRELRGDEIGNKSANDSKLMMEGESAKEERPDQHKQFIAALEKYGSNAGSESGTLAWHAMAEELQWPVEDIKVYAWSYFKALTEGRIQPWDSTTGPIKYANKSSWTCEELVLLDSLMLKYSRCLADGDDSSKGGSHLIRNSYDWEKIAANLPGKTCQDCFDMGYTRVKKTL